MTRSAGGELCQRPATKWKRLLPRERSARSFLPAERDRADTPTAPASLRPLHLGRPLSGVLRSPDWKSFHGLLTRRHAKPWLKIPGLEIFASIRDAIERVVILGTGPEVKLADLPERSGQGLGSCDEPIEVGRRVSLEALEDEHVRRVLRNTSSLEEAVLS